MTDDELLTRAMLARILQVKPRTVSEWTRRGRIPAVRISRKVIRYRIADVLAAIQADGRAKGGDA